MLSKANLHIVVEEGKQSVITVFWFQTLLKHFFFNSSIAQTYRT